MHPIVLKVCNYRFTYIHTYIRIDRHKYTATFIPASVMLVPLSSI